MVRRVGERRGQRPRGHTFGFGAGAGAHAQLVTRAHLDDEVGRLVGDPPPDVAGLGTVGIVEEPVNRGESGGRAGRLRAGQGEREGAHQPSCALGFRRLGLEPAHRVEHDAGGVRVAVESADQHEPALGTRRVERPFVLEGEQRHVVPRHAGPAHDPRLAAERGEGVELGLQVAAAPGRGLGAYLRGSSEPQHQPGRHAGGQGVTHRSIDTVLHFYLNPWRVPPRRRRARAGRGLRHRSEGGRTATARRTAPRSSRRAGSRRGRRPR